MVVVGGGTWLSQPIPILFCWKQKNWWRSTWLCLSQSWTSFARNRSGGEARDYLSQSWPSSARGGGRWHCLSQSDTLTEQQGAWRFQGHIHNTDQLEGLCQGLCSSPLVIWSPVQSYVRAQILPTPSCSFFHPHPTLPLNNQPDLHSVLCRSKGQIQLQSS